MTTDAISTELNSYLGRRAGVSPGSPLANTGIPADSAPAQADERQVSSAVRTIQAHFASRSAPPELRVDYLSGLSVVSVRAADTGELLYQMPGTDAVRLARLIADGAPPSMGVLDANV